MVVSPAGFEAPAMPSSAGSNVMATATATVTAKATAKAIVVMDGVPTTAMPSISARISAVVGTLTAAATRRSLVRWQ